MLYNLMKQRRTQMENNELLKALDAMVKAFITNSCEVMDEQQCNAEDLAMQALNKYQK